MPQRISDTGLLTTSSLILIAILAVITILGILWGMRLKRARRQADRIEEARVENEGGTTIDANAPIDPDAAPSPPRVAAPATPPVAPPPPPLETGPVIGTPVEPTLADEPVASAAPLAASPASGAAPEPEPAPSSASDSERAVTQIKGLGPKVAARLAELGLTNVGQIAALDASEAERLDAQLGPFTGRMARDRWIEQARFLAAGDVKGFEAVFGRL